MTIYNFSAGPATLPQEVLENAHTAVLDWHGSGLSILEISHRSQLFLEVIAQAEIDLRELLNIPTNYHVLFLAGGASFQFSMVPLNLLGKNTSADYIDTGIWSQKAIDEAKRYTNVNVAASGKANNYLTIPDYDSWQLNSNAAYCHYTDNETINGVEFPDVPPIPADVPIVSDMSSNLLSRPFDVTQFGLIYAGAQKNLGVAGLTLVIIRDDLLEKNLALTPTLLCYKTQAQHHSLYNTPPTFNCYVTSLIFSWIKQQGGLKAMAEKNKRKAEKLYSCIDNSGFYHNAIERRFRSIMNVPFSLPTPELEKLFLNQASPVGLVNLEGHRLVGGLRASIYNAMPEAGVDALIEFMQEFAKRNG